MGDGNSEIGNDMARKVLEKITYLEIKDGKVKATLTFTPDLYDFITEFKAEVDGDQSPPYPACRK